jgi:hypothetical protein
MVSQEAETALPEALKTRAGIEKLFIDQMNRGVGHGTGYLHGGRVKAGRA